RYATVATVATISGRSRNQPYADNANTPLARRAEPRPAAEARASTLVAARTLAHIRPMWTREQWHSFIDHPVVEWTIFVLGALLIIVSPLAGVIPGPGGIFVFAIGLAMVLKTS